MKKFAKILFLVWTILTVSSVFANGSDDKKATDQKNASRDEDAGSQNEESGKTTDQDEPSGVDNQENQKIVKNINNIIIESYKGKFAKILDELFRNIRGKSKEQKLKILTSVLYSTNTRIELIESGKVKIKANRKQILLSLLKYIKSEIEQGIAEVVNEK